MAISFPSDTLSPTEWFTRFRERYDLAASDPASELGVFYHRHVDFARGERSEAELLGEYSTSEWNQIMSGLLGDLARDFGFYQTTDPSPRQDILWFRPVEPMKLAALIVQEDQATEAVTEQELPLVVRGGAELGILVLYPDYPMPDGARTLEEATDVWKRKIESELARHRPPSDFLLLTLGTNSWELPSRWQAFAWDSAGHRLHPLVDRDRPSTPG
ncbi:MAG: hypothetical protein L3K15_01410 [Thermoplasmata archaeon]|nr:hypothetical protein [Thermoplasmata archaeon]